LRLHLAYAIIIIERVTLGGAKMDVMIIIALVIAIPVILFPAVFVWYLNVGGLWEAWKYKRAKDKKRARALV
jgi:hypothetical protein